MTGQVTGPGSQLGRDLLRYSRRQALVLFGAAAGSAALGSCDGAGAQGALHREPAGDDISGQAADGTRCMALPGETEGPFPADGSPGRRGALNVLDTSGVERRDLRSSFAGLTGTAEGVVLDLELTLVDVDNACAPLAGRAFYVWHCDAAGRYSLYEVADQNYLRGLQVSDADGIVRFRTVFPACYPGRFPHVHFEVFASGAEARTGSHAVLTSQLALPASACREVYQAAPPYRGSIDAFARVSLAGDGVFGDNSPAQLAAQTLAISGHPSTGYRGTGRIGLTTRQR